MTAKNYLRILQVGSLAALAIILLVFKDLLFPYITSKQLPFNILIELLFAFWIVFVLRYPEYRPRRNFMTYGLVAYFLAILASCFVSVDFNLSFWGDAERMLGVFHLAHFFVFYLIVITAFRNWREWRALLMCSAATATLVSLIGLLGPNPYSTIGNTAYVSGFLIFNIYFLILLFFRENNHLWRWLYILPLVPILLEFKNMKTSGAIIGLGVSVLILLLLVGLSHVQKRIRRASIMTFASLIVIIVIIFSQSQAAWFQHSFLRNLTSQKSTFQTRLISWKAAAADFKKHPLLGTGFGNYAIIFDRHFTSDFYNYTVGDTYFDRAHNNLIEIGSTTGVVGLIAYLSIFVAALVYLWREFRRNGSHSGPDANGLNNIEIIIIFSLLSAYFIQNLVIFDSFSTFLGLMMTLGFIYWLDQRRREDDTQTIEPIVKNSAAEIILLIALLISAYIFTNRYNIKPWKMFRGAIEGYSLVASGSVEQGIAEYKKVLIGRPLERDANVTLINVVAGGMLSSNKVSSQVAKETFDYAIFLAKENVANNPNDNLMQLQLAQLLDAAARYNYQDPQRFRFYSDQSLQAIDAAIAASPGRATTYFTKAQIELVRRDLSSALSTMHYGIDLNKNYYEGYCRISQVYMAIKDVKYDQQLDGALNSCIDKGAVKYFNVPTLLKMAVNYYSDKKDYAKAALWTEKLAEISDADSEVWFNLAKLYYVIGDKKKADTAFRRAYALDKSLDTTWVEFRKIIDSNRK